MMLWTSGVVEAQLYQNCQTDTSIGATTEGCLVDRSNPLTYTAADGTVTTLGTVSFLAVTCANSVPGTVETCSCFIIVNPSEEFTEEEVCNSCTVTAISATEFDNVFDCSNRLTGPCVGLDADRICINNENGVTPAPVTVPAPTIPTTPAPVDVSVPTPVPAPVISTSAPVTDPTTPPPVAEPTPPVPDPQPVPITAPTTTDEPTDVEPPTPGKDKKKDKKAMGKKDDSGKDGKKTKGKKDDSEKDGKNKGKKGNKEEKVKNVKEPKVPKAGKNKGD
jgi:hypothetical protein